MGNAKGHIGDSASVPTTSTNNESMDLCEDRGTSTTRNLAPMTPLIDLSLTRRGGILNPNTKEPDDPTLNAGKDAGEEIMTRQMEDMVIVFLFLFSLFLARSYGCRFSPCVSGSHCPLVIIYSF